MHKLTVKILIVESQFKKILTDDLFNIIFFKFFLFFTFFLFLQTSLGSKFLGSEYLYEELFPGLNETNAPTVGQKSRSLVSATKPDKSRLPGHPSSFETPKSCTKNQTSFPNNFPQKAHHSNNTANSNKSTSENTINQSSFPSLKDSIPNKATTSKTSFQQIHLSRNQVAVQSTMKSTSLSSGLSVKGNGNGYKMSHSVTPIVPCVEPIPKAKTKKSLGDCEKKCGKVHATTQPLIPKPTS